MPYFDAEDSIDENVKTIQSFMDQKPSDEHRAFGYYQRLNMAGADFKGQMSTAYAQFGRGYGGSVGVDFFKPLVPFCHASIDLSGKYEKPAYSLIFIQRGAAMAWDAPVKLPTPHQSGYSFAQRDANGDVQITNPLAVLRATNAPHWQGDKPLICGHLRGYSKTYSGNLAASIWAGVGKNFATDESGASIGLGAEGEYEGFSVMLSDSEVCHFGASAYDSLLMNHIDDIMIMNLRERTANWLIKMSKGQAQALKDGNPHSWVDYVNEFGGVIDSVIDQPLRDANRNITGRSAVEALGILKKTAKELDANYLPDNITEEIPSGAFGAALRGFATLGKAVWNRHKDRSLDPRKLKADVVAYRAKIQQAIDAWDDETKANPPLPEYFTKERIEQTIKGYQGQLAEADDLLAAMKRIPGFEVFTQMTARPTPDQDPQNPMCFLELTGSQRWGKAAAGLNIKIPKEVLALGGAAIYKNGSKRLAYRYQTFAPGKDAANADRAMMTTQDTAIHYNLRIFRVQAQAQMRNFSHKPTLDDSKKILGGKKSRDFWGYKSWGCLTYESVTVNWLNTRDGMGFALPNGSGISFGVSVLAGRFERYAAECKALQIAYGDPDNAIGPPDSQDARRPEAIMMQALHVTGPELRAFAVSAAGLYGHDLKEAKHAKDKELKSKGAVHSETSILIEAGFAIQDALPITITNNRPELMDKHMIFESLKRDVRMGVDLQSIRMRMRLKSDEDKCSSIFDLGVSPQPVALAEGKMPFADKAALDQAKKNFLNMLAFKFKQGSLELLKRLPINVSVSAKRVKRVGSEGIFDLHVKYFQDVFEPDLDATGEEIDKDPAQARDLADKTSIDVAEITVPPVKLFSQ